MIFFIMPNLNSVTIRIEGGILETFNERYFLLECAKDTFQNREKMILCQLCHSSDIFKRGFARGLQRY